MTVLDALTVAEAIGDVSAKSVILPSNGHALGACVGTRCAQSKLYPSWMYESDTVSVVC